MEQCMKILILSLLMVAPTFSQASDVTSRDCINQFDHALTVLNGDEGVTFTRTSSFVEIQDSEEESRSFTLAAMVRVDSASVDESPVTVESESKFFTATCVMEWPISTNYKMYDRNDDGILNQSDFNQLDLKN